MDINEQIYIDYIGGATYADLMKKYSMTRGQIAGVVNRQRKKQGPAQPVPTSAPKISDDTPSPNMREVAYSGDRILSLEDLLKACGVNPDDWIVERWLANKWEVGRKAVQEDMKWVNGLLSGTKKDDGDINAAPLFQIKAWLVRKVPVQVKPVVTPIIVEVKREQRPTREPTKTRIALILPDPHFGFTRNVQTGEMTPFHDREALSVAMQIAEIVRPDVTAWLGDVIDFAGWSDKFVRRPEFYFTTQAALIEAAWVIGQVRRFTLARCHVIEGNHDLRPETTMINHLLDAYELRAADQLDKAAVLSIENLLGLDRMGVTYQKGYPSAGVWLNDTTRLEHGNTVKGAPGGSARAVVEKEDVNVIFGHIHRMELASRTVWGRGGMRTITAMSPGCLCSTDGRVPGSTRGAQWQQGAAVVYYNDTSASIVPVPIVRGRAIFQGQTVEAVDYFHDLRGVSSWGGW